MVTVEFSSIAWLVMAGIAILAELVSFTFYFAVLAAAFVIGAVIAYLTPSITIQVTITTALAIVGILLVKKQRARLTDNSNNMISDVGRIIEIKQWHNGVANVKYRGTVWKVLPQSATTTLAPGQFVIVDVKGPLLVVNNYHQ